MTERRKYVLTQIARGDYIFPSNDGEQLWRVSAYEEDGSLEVSDGNRSRRIKGRFWQAWRFKGTPAEAQRLVDHDPDGFLDWERWESWESLLPTRKAAVENALTHAARLAGRA